jgi:AcrR family transcriptional regulator
MQPGDWRTRRFEATHQRIYAVAIELFQEHGFEQVSIGQIAAGAAVSVPTFYAHFPSKEHLVMRVPVAEDFAALLAGQPTELPLPARFRQAVLLWLSQWPPEERADAFARWTIIATTPSLRTRAAEFERTAGGLVADALPTEPGQALPAGHSVLVDAYMAAYTAALLAWADGDGARPLEELIEEAFDALDRI